jgi:hypothetical protein
MRVTVDLARNLVRRPRTVALPTFSMGETRPGIDLDHALDLALDEVAVLRRLDDRG